MSSKKVHLCDLIPGQGSGIAKLLAVGYHPQQLIAMGYPPSEMRNFPSSRHAFAFNHDLTTVPAISTPMDLPGIDDPVGLVALMQQLEINDCPRTLFSRALPQVQFSDFPRKITVEAGLIMFSQTLSKMTSSKSRFWIPSSFTIIQRSLFQYYEPLQLMTFEFGSLLESVETNAFWLSNLKMILIPASVKVLCKSCFHFCHSLRNVTFECGSRLERIENNAFDTSSLEMVIIPASVNFLGERCFEQIEQLASVVFESGLNLRRMGVASFAAAGSLKSIIIPASIEVINAFLFEYCKSLELVEFETGSHVQQIEEFSFRYTALTELTLPNSVHFISGCAFEGVHLNFVSFLPSPSIFCVRDDMIEDISSRSFIYYFGKARSIEIPKYVEAVGEGCFFHHRFLESITFETGSRLERIGKNAFQQTELKGLFVIPRGVKILSRGCFSWCRSLQSIIFESGCELQTIGDRAFESSSLERIVIPASVEVINEQAFCCCNSLKLVTFESGSRLQQLGDEAFSSSGLKTIVIPASVEVINRRAFAECHSLESVMFESGSRLRKIGSALFSDCPCRDAVIFPSSFTDSH
jgi:hypothetical protein